jgi:hypothetical protein
MELDRVYIEKNNDAIEREALDWNPQGNRNSRGPKQTLRRSINSGALEQGKSRGVGKMLARNRIRSRRFVGVLCP